MSVKKLISLCATIALLTIVFASCKKVAGLELQQNYEYQASTIDPNINKTAWQFLKDRATGQPDTIFKRMYDAILYSGIDTAEYTKPNRTYIFLHNDAVVRGTATDTYWGRYKVNNKAATKWSDYTPQQVKNWLLGLIVEGKYSFDNVTPDFVEAKTLLPPGTDPANPKSIIIFNVINDRNSKFTINGFPNTVRTTTVRTAGILSTNGPVHVVDRLVEYGIK